MVQQIVNKIDKIREEGDIVITLITRLTVLLTSLRRAVGMNTAGTKTVEMTGGVTGKCVPSSIPGRIFYTRASREENAIEM